MLLLEPVLFLKEEKETTSSSLLCQNFCSEDTEESRWYKSNLRISVFKMRLFQEDVSDILDIKSLLGYDLRLMVSFWSENSYRGQNTVPRCLKGNTFRERHCGFVLVWLS
jgi:hypothetical protein